VREDGHALYDLAPQMVVEAEAVCGGQVDTRRVKTLPSPRSQQKHACPQNTAFELNLGL
jgi:hypothetical protein